MTITDTLTNSIQDAVNELFSQKIDIILEHPSLEEHGDYTTNVAMTLAKELKKSPMEVASRIVANLPKINFVQKIEVAKPGFINFKLTDAVLLKELKKIVKEGNKYGSSKQGKGKTVVIDYSSPNIAKRFSIGHLRSTIIGQVLHNLYKFSGWTVIGDNHL